MMEVVVTTGAIRRAKLQSNHDQENNTQLFAGQMPFCCPTNSVKGLKESTFNYLSKINIFSKLYSSI